MALLGLEPCALYLHDYGAQVGFRLASRAPLSVGALVIQNSEAYYGPGRSRSSWATVEKFWRDPSPPYREAVRSGLFTEQGIERELLENLPPNMAELLDPAVIRLARAQISRPGVIDAMLDLHLDYQTNVDRQPSVQAYLRERRPPALILWGQEDSTTSLRPRRRTSEICRTPRSTSSAAGTGPSRPMARPSSRSPAPSSAGTG